MSTRDPNSYAAKNNYCSTSYYNYWHKTQTDEKECELLVIYYHISKINNRIMYDQYVHENKCWYAYTEVIDTQINIINPNINNLQCVNIQVKRRKELRCNYIKFIMQNPRNVCERASQMICKERLGLGVDVCMYMIEDNEKATCYSGKWTNLLTKFSFSTNP